jgi:DNA polymerase-3 subunit delta
MGKTLEQYKAFFDSLQSSPPRRIYLLYGGEEFMKKEIVGSLIQRMLPGENRMFNLDIFYGDEFDRNAFRDRISSYPLFAEHRMVILKKYEALAAANREFVLECLASIPDSLTVVVESADEKAEAPKLRTIRALAESQGIAFDCKHLTESETLKRVKARLKKEGFGIEPEALDLLVDSVGTQMLDLVNEIDKIAILSQGTAVITRDAVKEVIGRYRAESVFAFINRLESQELGDNLKMLNMLLDDGEEPIFILAMLFRKVLQLLQAQLQAAPGGRAGSGRSAAAGRGETVPYADDVRARRTGDSRRLDMELLFENLMWADEKIKTTQISERTILEEAVIASHLRKKLATFSG